MQSVSGATAMTILKRAAKHVLWLVVIAGWVVAKSTTGSAGGAGQWDFIGPKASVAAGVPQFVDTRRLADVMRAHKVQVAAHDVAD